MTAPRAVGVRAPYSAMPETVHQWVEATLGSPVVESAEQTGGMSPGCATRLRCADGTRAFVKAVTTELNPHTPTLFRREITTLGLLGSHDLWADLLASYDDGACVALLLEDVEGRHPDLDDDATMATLVAATEQLTAVMRSRVPGHEARAHVGGVAHEPGLVDTAAVLRAWAGSFPALADAPDAPVPPWVRAAAEGWEQRVRDLATMAMDHLVHYDIRNDNLLQRPSGRIVFLDWGAAGVGPDWLDPLLARLERVHLPWFDDSLATSPELVAAGEDTVTTWLVGIGTFLAWRAVTAVDVNLPTLADFRRREADRFLGAAARRLDLGG